MVDVAVRVSDELLDKYRSVSNATVLGELSRRDYKKVYMNGVHSLAKGRRLVGRAVTLRYLPSRPDLQEYVTRGGHGEGFNETPRWDALEALTPGDVLVADIQGDAKTVVAGDVKLLQLKMNNADGVVIDGAIRDLDVLRDEDYGLTVYATARSLHGGPNASPAEEDIQIQCGGALVRPGDVMVGDDDGVIVVPSWMAAEVLEYATEHEEVENYIKEKIAAENVAPGKYYPPQQESFEEWRRVKNERGL